MRILFGAALVCAMALATAAPTSVAAQRPPDPHCVSVRPDRLALTPGQVAKVRDIVASEPESAHRRAEIIAVLTRTQWQVYWRTAGIAAC